MKPTLRILAIISVLALLSGCCTVSTNQSALEYRVQKVEYGLQVDPYTALLPALEIITPHPGSCTRHSNGKPNGPLATAVNCCIEFDVVNVSRLEEIFSDGDVVDCDSLVAKGVIKTISTPIKVLGNGEITKKLTVRVTKVSGSAKSKIESAGGTVETSC